MTDIVERLRNTHRGEWLEVRPAMLNDAADEIERLRKELAAWERGAKGAVVFEKRGRAKPLRHDYD